ncbi:MAG: archaellin/type IV pilin N-terminal domain-containing protein [Candidatus Aenigmatarchaeota archaeon]
MSKGVSTFIAAILLIAFTVAVGGIISFWLTGFTTTSTGSVEASTTNQTKCAGAYIKIDSVTATRIIYSNPSNQAISSINIIAGDGTSILSGGSTLNPGSVNSVGWTRGTNTSVIAKGLCLATVPVEGSCKSGDSCWSS